MRRGELPSCLGVGKTTIPAVGTSVGRFFGSSILFRHRDIPGEVEPTECPWPAPSQAGCLRGRVRGKSDKAPVLLPLPHLGPVPFCVQDPGEQSRSSTTWAPSMVPQLSLLDTAHCLSCRHRWSSSWPKTCPLMPFWNPFARVAHALTSAGCSWRNCRSCCRKAGQTGTLQALWGAQVSKSAQRQSALPLCRAEQPPKTPISAITLCLPVLSPQRLLRPLPCQLYL